MIGDFQLDILKEGLYAYAEIAPYNRKRGLWFKILKIDEGITEGLCDIKEFGPKYYKQKFKFHYSNILRLRGDMEWNKEHLFVRCSQRVLDGAQVGYFYRSLVEIPLCFGWYFYSTSEIVLDKTKIPTSDVLLSDFLRIHAYIEPYLVKLGYYGLIKDGSTYKELNESDIHGHQRNIFPSAIELD